MERAMASSARAGPVLSMMTFRIGCIVVIVERTRLKYRVRYKFLRNESGDLVARLLFS